MLPLLLLLLIKLIPQVSLRGECRLLLFLYPSDSQLATTWERKRRRQQSTKSQGHLSHQLAQKEQERKQVSLWQG